MTDFSKHDSEIVVTQSTSGVDGGCNACTAHHSRNGVSEHVVWVVNARSISIRLCRKCRKDLMLILEYINATKEVL